MEKLALYMRMTGLAVSNEDVDSRQKAIAELATTWGKITSPLTIAEKAADISSALGGDPPASLSAEVEKAVQKRASAFLSSESPLEVGICAGGAGMSVITQDSAANGWTTAVVYSNALWLALSFQPSLSQDKREQLRRDVLDRAVEASLKSANACRARVAVPDVSELSIEIAEAKASANLKKVIGGTIDALRRNAALDREELDFLWWSQTGRSRVLNRRLVDIAEPTRLVAMGIEAVAQLRRLPADVHREIVLRTIDADPELDLIELLEAIGPDRAALAARTPRTAVDAAPSVYPLLSALAGGNANIPGADVKRAVSDWAGRALLEAAMARFTVEGISKP